jgi:hypothetical protein
VWIMSVLTDAPIRCPERRAMPKRRYERKAPTHEWRSKPSNLRYKTPG